MKGAALAAGGSDSSGGAGIQADLETFSALEVRGFAAITAVTVQTDSSVAAIHPVPPEIVHAQIESAVLANGVRVLKTGMLWSADTALAIAELVLRFDLLLVADPVLRASSGRDLVADRSAYLSALKARLLPRTFVFTPNLDEVEALLGERPKDEAGMIRAANALRELGAKNVAVKGGHLAGDPIDVLVGETGEARAIGAPRIARKIRGTGCRFASALAAHLALGASVGDAFLGAHGFVRRALASGRG